MEEKIGNKIGKKIGVFDSGFGGLNILKYIKQTLGEYDYLYLGDSLRSPYGERSHAEIFEFVKEALVFFFKEGVELVILACNSASAEALRQIQQEFLPKNFRDKKVLGVIIPTVEEVIYLTKNKKVSLLATNATVKSGTFEKEIKKLDEDVKVESLAAPLLVPMIEKGEFDTYKNEKVIEGYIKEVLKNGADTLILGCTHYSIIKNQIEKFAKDVAVIEEGPIVALKLEDYLKRHVEIEQRLSKNGSLEFFTTGDKNVFDTLGTKFFGEKVDSKKIVL